MEAAAVIAPLSRREAVVVKRDRMTETSLIVWQHEIPLLEAIHGADGIVVVITDKIREDSDAGYKADPKDPYRYKPSEVLGLGDVFIGDAAGEYARLEQVYGMDKEVKMSVVEKVYGPLSHGRFTALLGKPTLQDYSARQLRAHLMQDLDLYPDERDDRGGIITRDWRPNAGRDELLKLATKKRLKEAA
jgi:hypothetical protein